MTWHDKLSLPIHSFSCFFCSRGWKGSKAPNACGCGCERACACVQCMVEMHHAAWFQTHAECCIRNKKRAMQIDHPTWIVWPGFFVSAWLKHFCSWGLAYKLPLLFEEGYFLLGYWDWVVNITVILFVRIFLSGPAYLPQMVMVMVILDTEYRLEWWIAEVINDQRNRRWNKAYSRLCSTVTSSAVPSLSVSDNLGRSNNA